MSDYKCTITQSCEDFEWEGFTINFEAEATSVHEDCVMYYKDGSGYPGYDGIEDIQVHHNAIYDEDGNEFELGEDNYPISFTEEQKKKLEAAIDEYLDKHDWDYPEPDYPEPPDED